MVSNISPITMGHLYGFRKLNIRIEFLKDCFENLTFSSSPLPEFCFRLIAILDIQNANLHFNQGNIGFVSSTIERH